MKISSGQFKILELRNVGRSFGDAHALRNLDVSIKAGEFIALLGPSGCGKSTALNCLAGLLPLTHGEIFLDDRRLDVLPPEKRDFGMVFQNYALFPHLSVAKNIAFGLEQRKLPKDVIRQRVQEALELVKLEGHVDKLPGQLSGGQQQRVAIARAVALQPTLVLMDEPLSNLDAKLRLEMRAEIRRLHELLGLTTIYVTHDQEEALSMADRLIVLREGEVQQIGAPEQVHQSPANWYVADFMGYRNIVDVHVEKSGGGEYVASTADFKITASAQDLRGNGDAVLAVRPEDLTIAATGDDVTPDQEGIHATVFFSEYQGHRYSLIARSESGIRFFIHHDVPLDAGTQVVLRAKPGRALLYDRDPQQAAPELHDVG